MSKQYTCGWCLKTGHNKRTCPDLVGSNPAKVSTSKKTKVETSEPVTYCTYCKSNGYSNYSDHTKADCYYARKIHCSFCGTKGHTIKKCPEVPVTADKFNKYSKDFCESLNTLLNTSGFLPGSLVTINVRNQNFRYTIGAIEKTLQNHGLTDNKIAANSAYNEVHFYLTHTFLLTSVKANPISGTFAGCRFVDGSWASMRPFEIEFLSLGTTLEITDSFRNLLRSEKFGFSDEQIASLENDLQSLAKNKDAFELDTYSLRNFTRMRCVEPNNFEAILRSGKNIRGESNIEFNASRAVEKHMTIISYDDSQSFEQLLKKINENRSTAERRRMFRKIRIFCNELA